MSISYDDNHYNLNIIYVYFLLLVIDFLSYLTWIGGEASRILKFISKIFFIHISIIIVIVVVAVKVIII